MPQIKLDNKEIFYEITGEGIPVVLLHGFCEDHRVWDSIYSNLPAQVLRLDLPGFGNSESISEPRIDDYASFVYNVAKNVGFEKFILFGHSMGGYIGMNILKNKPEVLLGLGLVHSHPFGDTAETIEKRNKSIEFVKKNGSKNYAKTMFPNLFQNAEEYGDTISTLVNRCAEYKVSGIVNALKAMRDRPDLSASLTDADMPVFYFTGKEDPAIPVERLLKVISETPISWVNVTSNAAHMGMYEATSILIRDMNSFIEYCKI